MDFTKHEQTFIRELEKRAGDVLYLEDIAPYFITNSCLQISTYTQTAYIQLGDNMQNALSEYFQLVVFIKKLEQNGACFSIPYTPLKDNLVQIGNSDYEEYQQHTIADGDLLIQLFHYSAKKYVMAPNVSVKFDNPIAATPIAKQNKLNFIIPSFILLLLFVFIGTIGYLSYEDQNRLRMKQEAMGSDLKQQTQNIKLLSTQIKKQGELQKEIQTTAQKEVSSIGQSLKEQNKSLKSIRYWNIRQSEQLESLQSFVLNDSSSLE